jgi:SAM-dependent methyltransferase
VAPEHPADGQAIDRAGDGDRDYVAVNRRNWDSRVEIHARGYRLDRFLEDPAHLSDVVRFDLPRLGDVRGLDAVHLQCHIGSDTVSLARLGARMTGLDFSPPALEVARRLAADCGEAVEYVQAEVYDAPAVLGTEQFDLVYTGVGALCWLPDVRRWAEVVATLLRPGGRLFIREGHPMLWALCDPREDELVVVEFPYFETPTGTVFFEPNTYVEHDEELASPEIISFNHGIGEILTALAGVGLHLDHFEEHQSVPWNPLGAAMVELPNGEFQLRERPERLAASYTLKATKLPTAG